MPHPLSYHHRYIIDLLLQCSGGVADTAGVSVKISQDKNKIIRRCGCLVGDAGAAGVSVKIGRR